MTHMLTIVDKVLFLQNVDIFNHATTEELAFIGSIAREVEKPQGSILFREDESADAMYLVVSGKVRLHKADQEIFSRRRTPGLRHLGTVRRRTSPDDGHSVGRCPALAN